MTEGPNMYLVVHDVLMRNSEQDPKMSPIINLNCTTKFIFTILYVVYYRVDITLVYFSAVWSCFFSAVQFFFGRPVFFWPSSFFLAVQFFFGRPVFYLFGCLDSAECTMLFKKGHRAVTQLKHVSDCS